MISLETAKKLKDVGLKWEPAEGDSYYFEKTLEHIYPGTFFYGASSEMVKMSCIAFAPSLSQLLAEIEKRGYWWDIGHRIVEVGKIHKYKIWASKKHANNTNQEFITNSPEESAAQALLWILKEGCN